MDKTQVGQLIDQIKHQILQRRLIDISPDSRQCDAHSIFVALAGQTVDGRAFIANVVNQGTRVVFVEKPPVADGGISDFLAGNSLFSHAQVPAGVFSNLELAQAHADKLGSVGLERYLENQTQSSAADLTSQEHTEVANDPVDVFAIADLANNLSFIALKFFDFLQIVRNPECLGLELPVIGVTGTNGKTLTANLISQGLRLLEDKPVRHIGTIGLGSYPDGLVKPTAFVTTPDACTTIREQFSGQVDGASALVMEVSSHALVLNRVRHVRFHQAIFTNLTQDHLDFHHTLEEYFLAKADLFLHHNVRDYIIATAGDDYGARLVKMVARKLATANQGETAKGTPAHAAASFSLAGGVPTADHIAGSSNTRPNPLGHQLPVQGGFADLESRLQANVPARLAVINLGQCDHKTTYPADIVVSLHSYACVADGLEFSFSLSDKLVGLEANYQVKSSLMGDFNVHNLLATITSLYLRKRSQDKAQLASWLDKVVALVPKLTAVKGRMEVIANKLGKTLVVDFAHSPDALEKALVSLRAHAGSTSAPTGADSEPALAASAGKTGQKLWVVFGCGGDRDAGKRPLMGEIAGRLADYVVVTDDNPRTENAEKIAQAIIAGCQNREITYIANRKDAIKHAVVHAQPGDLIMIAGKGHETEQIYGTVKQHFSDQEACAQVLAELERL